MFAREKRLLKSNSFKKIVLSLLISILFSVPPQAVFSQEDAGNAISLELNKAIEREIAGAERHVYRISLDENQFVSVSAGQKGVDVILRLTDETGTTLAEFDSEMRLGGTETLEFAAEKGGNYLLEVRARYKLLPAGKYEIIIEERRAATARDKFLQQARDLYAESVRQFSAGKYAEAKPLIESAFEIRRRELGRENSLTAAAMSHLARITDALGNYDEAERMNLQVLEIREKTLGSDHPDVGYTLNYLATVNNHKEDFQKALEYHRRALAVREKAFGENHPVVAVSLINLGVVYDALGDKFKARELYARALKIQEQTVGAENLNFAIILNNIGKIYNDLREFEKAEPYLLRAAAILEKLFPPDNPRIYDSLTNLAECYAERSELEKAESIYLRILASREKTYGENHPLTAHVVYNLGNLYAVKYEFDKAEAFYRRALLIRENTLGTESPGVSEVLSALALALAQRGDVGAAIKLQRRAGQIDEYNIGLNLTIGSERQKLAFLNNLSDRINQNISLHIKFAPGETEAVELAAATVLRQKGRVLDAVSNNIVELRRRLNPQDGKLLDRLNETGTKMAELILNKPEDASIEEHQAEIKFLSDERERLEDEISRRAAGFFIKSSPVTLDSVKKLIPGDAALLEFAVYYSEPDIGGGDSSGAPRYAVYVLRAQGQVKWKDLGDKKQIDEAIADFRRSLRDPGQKDTNEKARAADEKILQGARSLLGGAKRLFISPDGDLNLIPFEALVTEQGNYLIEDFSITYLTSGRDLLRMQAPRRSKSKPLIIANPLFGEAEAFPKVNSEIKRKPKKTRKKRRSVTAARDLAETFFAPLGGTLQEARSIGALFPEAEFLTAEKATESALKKISAPEILHIATHGFFLQNAENDFKNDSKTAARAETSGANARSENPLLRSGLAFSGANERRSGADDGILTALEASGLNLWGTKLVVLSACDTGLGEVRNGEGVYGLRRSFVLAGTESLVMSLWSVSDYATRELMTDYYKNLKQGFGRGEALRRVQLEMLKKGARRHPFYWASFIQSGEWANLDGKR